MLFLRPGSGARRADACAGSHECARVGRLFAGDAGADAHALPFADAIADTQTQGVDVTRDVAILAAVGDGMVGIPGVAARST